MKLTLNECLARINQVLNYPTIAYEDIYHFLDQAIEELNTSLRIGIPTVSEMVSENKFNIADQPNLIAFPSYPSTLVITATPSKPETAPEENAAQYVYYCASANYLDRAFYKWNGAEWIQYDRLYAIVCDGSGSNLSTVPVSTTTACWVPFDNSRIQDFDLTEYLPMSWWTLFIIPYVCFKYSVRNNDSGELFVDEFTQGFQQLNSTYSIPNTVRLSDVAGKPAYKKVVAANLYNLNVQVPTAAITEDMRVGTGIHSVFGGFYETGGWGV